MKLFVCASSRLYEEAKSIQYNLQEIAKSNLHVRHHFIYDPDWKSNVKKQLSDSDIALFIVDDKTELNGSLEWEFRLAERYGLKVYVFSVNPSKERSVINYHGIIYSEIKLLAISIDEYCNTMSQLLLEQYKIMVKSTEKVTDQRMKVNNLFLTLSSSLLTLVIVIGNSFHYSVVGIIIMIMLTAFTLLINRQWKKLINSYGILNTGKFKIINSIENMIGVNMFQSEWTILQDKLNYEPNSKTEMKVVDRFNVVVIVALFFELAYLFFLWFNYKPHVLT